MTDLKVEWNERITAIDLFAGAGGLSLGFEWAGVKVTHAVEIDKWAAQSYAANFPDTTVLCRDITTITDQECIDLSPEGPDLLFGGPPCQGFSLSNGKNRDPHDPRNSLFEEFIRWANILRPQACLIENVKGLLTTRTGEGRLVVDVIMREFRRIGYHPQYTLLNAADYGVAQNRERLFIVAFREDLSQSFSWPTRTHAAHAQKQEDLFDGTVSPFVALWDAISDLPPEGADAIGRPGGYVCPPANVFQGRMRERTVAIINHEPMKHTSRIIERLSAIGYGESEDHSPEHLAPRKRGSLERQGLDKAYAQNSRRQRPDRICNTVVASSHTNFIHPFLNRNFTVRELARIQSFPDWFVFRGKRAVLSRKLSERKGLVDDLFLDQRMQVGNAVPPILASQLAEVICAHIRLEIAR